MDALPIHCLRESRYGKYSLNIKMYGAKRHSKAIAQTPGTPEAETILNPSKNGDHIAH